MAVTEPNVSTKRNALSFLWFLLALAAIVCACLILTWNAPRSSPQAILRATADADVAHAQIVKANMVITAATSRARSAKGNSVKTTAATLIKARRNLTQAQNALSAAQLRLSRLQSSAASPYFGWFGVLALAVLWLISALFGGSANPLALAMGLDNRLSSSKMQALIWTACVGFVYAMFYADRLLTQNSVNPITQVPQNVLIALGMSVTSVVAAKALTSSQVASNPDSKDTLNTPSYDPAALVRDDGSSGVSLTKVQMLFWTVVAVVSYIVASFHQLATVAACNDINATCNSLPDIYTMLMAFMGLGQATYLGAKFASGTTPSLSSASGSASNGGAVVTLRGANLGSSGSITINGTDLSPNIRSWTPTSVVFDLPDPIANGWPSGSKLAIAIVVSGVSSTPIVYTYTAPTAPVSGQAQTSSPPPGPQAARPPTTAQSLQQISTSIPNGYVHGIDVSYAQTTAIDWDKVRQTNLAKFAYSRATCGLDPSLDDENFVRNQQNCKRLGIAFGAYHYFIFGDPGDAQADRFLGRLKGLSCDLQPMVDIEDPHGSEAANQIIANLDAFIKAVESALSTKVIIYTNQDTWNTRLGGSDAFSGHRLWVANPNNDPTVPPAMPEGFPDWTIYQYSWTGSIPLLGTPQQHAVDLNVLKGDLSLISLRGSAPAAPAKAPIGKAAYDGTKKSLTLFDRNGEAMFSCEAHNDSVAKNAWRPDAGCPPGRYVLAAPESNDPRRANTADNDWIGEGLWFIPINGIPGHDGIGIHGGGTCKTPPNQSALLARQGWCPTENCIRVQNTDLATLVTFNLANLAIDVVQP
jgi:lysozyme